MSVRVTADNVDQDLYIYETKLNFGLDFGKKVLQEVERDMSQFPLRNNYDLGNDVKAMVRKIGREKAAEIYRRKHQVLEYFPDPKPIQFHQLYLTPSLRDELIDLAPKWITELAGPDPILQVGGEGNILPPHKGHYRKCSIFLLLQSGGEETRWYRNTEDFEVIDPLRIPDLDKVEQVISATIPEMQWIVFNHKEWHSVHNYGGMKNRVNIGIDFFDIEAPDLVRVIKQHGY